MGAIIQELLRRGVGGLMNGGGDKRTAGQSLSDSYAWAKKQDEQGLMEFNMPKPELKDEPYADILGHNAATKKYDARKAEVEKNNDPLEVWKRQIENLMASGHPELQKQAMSMMDKYHDKNVSQPKREKETTAIEEWRLAKSQGYEGNFTDWKLSNKSKMFADKLITPADAVKMEWIDPAMKGKPMVGMSFAETKGRVRARSEGERGEHNKKETATRITDELETMLFGDQGIYNDFGSDSKGIKGKMENLWEANSQYFLQNDSRFKSYTDFAEGTLSSVVRSLGEVGNLADEDIARARALIPSLFGAKIDTPDIAREKIAKLRRLINLKEEGTLNSDTFKATLGDFGRVWKTGDGPKEGVYWAEDE